MCLHVSILVGGCANRRRSEAENLMRLVQTYREASMTEKTRTAEALEGFVCTVPETCKAKEACVASSRPTVLGLKAKAEAERAMHGEGDQPMALRSEVERAAIVAKIDAAAANLEAGKLALEGCAVEIEVLRQQFGGF